MIHTIFVPKTMVTLSEPINGRPTVQHGKPIKCNVISL